jgi:hypothetical protein
MREADFDEFSRLLDATCKLVTRNAYTHDAQNTALFFRAVSAYSLSEVRAAFDAHIRDPKRGRFAPTPSDLIAHVATRGDGRPGADEAWAIALKGRDEADTVVWTQEILTAWTTSREVLGLGDEVGARMAFREVYERLVRESRASGAKVEWRAMLGHDAGRRESVLRAAVDAGLLAAPDVLLLGYDVTLPRPDKAQMPPEVAARLSAIRLELGERKAVEEPVRQPQGKQFQTIPRDALPPALRDDLDEARAL